MKTRALMQRGFSAIELIVCLAIAAAILTVVAANGFQANSQSTVTKFVANMNKVQQFIQTQYAGQPNYLGIGYNVLLQQGAIPPALQNPISSSFGITPWGSIWRVFAQPFPGDATSAGDLVEFTFSVNDLKGCIQVAQQIGPQSLYMHETNTNTDVAPLAAAGATRDNGAIVANAVTVCTAAFATAGKSANFQYFFR
jgi:prepilin-type N-terminal cleavage/methylation domain-containing protein